MVSALRLPVSHEALLNRETNEVWAVMHEVEWLRQRAVAAVDADSDRMRFQSKVEVHQNQDGMFVAQVRATMGHAVLCCAVLCCAVLCCAVLLRCAVLCCAAVLPH